jgi:PAS domain S-box-containing protein
MSVGLKKSVERLDREAQLLDLSDAAIIERQFDGTIIYWNQGAQRLYGWPAEEALGKNLHELLQTKFPVSQAAMEQELVQNAGWTGKFRQRRRDGGLVTVLCRKILERDAEGQPAYVLETNTDVTALDKSERRFRSFVEATASVIWRTNAIGEVDSPVPSWNAFTGQTNEEAAGFGWMNIIHPDDRRKVRAAWGKAVAEKTTYEVEYRLQLSSGDWRHVLARGVPMLDENDAITEFIGTCIDVTEQRRAQERLRESEERFRQLGENIPQLAWMTHADGSIFWYNKRWFEYTGTTLDQMQGWGWQLMHHPDFTKRVVQKWVKHLESGDPWEDTFPLRGKDGEYRWFLSRAFPIRNENGAIVRWFGTNTDITEQRKTADELRQLKDELEVRVEHRTAELNIANRELEAFGYTVSHDLRAPLRHVDGFIQMLRKHAGPALDEKSVRYLNIVSDSARRMGHLIDDLLMLSRVGRAEMSKSAVDLGQLVEEARQQLAPLMEGRAIEWKVGPMPVVHGDAILLRTVVANLLSNAIKYSRVRTPAIIEVGSENLSGEVVCFVRDNGVGFDMRFVNQLFGVFQRLHRAEEFEGTGVGLASVRRIIERHGGKVWAEAAVDKGAAFYFSLPREENHG